MQKISIASIAKSAEDIQLESKYLFPESTEKQLRWCAVRGALLFATQMAHFLRTDKDHNGNLVFPDILSETTSSKNDMKAADNCAKTLYESQTLLLQLSKQYQYLLQNHLSINNMIDEINKTTSESSNDNCKEILQKQKGMTPPWQEPWEPGHDVNVRVTNQANIHKFFKLTADKLRIGNMVIVPIGYKTKIVKINAVTKRKIGYATESGTGERYVRLREVKPLPVSDSSMQLIGFKLVDEYVFDGKNYYDNVYNEKLIDYKSDLYDLRRFKKATVRKYEYFIKDKYRFEAYIISNTEDVQEQYVQLNTTTKIGSVLQVYYPASIHEIQNFISWLDEIALSHVKVHLIRDRKVYQSDYDK